MRRLPPNSAMTAAAASLVLPARNPVSNGRQRSRQRLMLLKRQQRQQRPCWRRIVTVLVGIVLLFAVLDLFELVVVSKHHKLSEIRPALQQQKEKVVQVWRNEKEVIKKELSSLLQLHNKQKRGPPTEDPYSDTTTTDAAKQIKDKGMDTHIRDETGLANDDVDFDKEQIYEILEQAGVKRHQIDVDTRRKLPTWTKVQELYGKEPKIYGLDRCEAFTSRIEPSVSFFGIAGTFNSGTNLLAEMLIQNCQITKRMQVFGEDQRGMRWQVPWGKHTPVEYREEHVTETDRDVPLENSFPMLTIRDPYRWMQSMCKHIYGARWPHNRTACPHVYMDEFNKPSPVRVKYKNTIVNHASLPGMWNDWYNHYLEQEFPRVIVRFEDLLFYGKNVTQTLCKCGGGDPRRSKFVHVKSSAKLGTAAHGANKTGLLDAIIQYGTDNGRLTGFTKTDLEWSHKLLDPNLMEMFAYPYALNY